jgi:hypothetical protein
MKTDTPETDAYKGTHETHRIKGKTIYGHAESLEREAELAAAKELLREIRDNEVNPQDEADKFLRDHQPSELAKWRAVAEGLATAIQEQAQTEEALKAALAAYEAARKA